MVNSKLLKRLQKLKALADDPNGNPNETAAAAALYAEIMAEHGISQTEIEFEAQEIKIFDFLEPGASQMVTWQIVLLNSLARTSCCQLLVRARMGPDDDSPENVVIVGAMENVQAMDYSFRALKRQIESLCETWAKGSSNWPPVKRAGIFSWVWGADGHLISLDQGGSPREVTQLERQEFCKGVAMNVAQRLERAYGAKLEETKRKPEHQEATGLVPIDRQQAKVRETVNERLGGACGERAVQPEDHRAFFAGTLEGEKIQLEANGGALTGQRGRLR